MKKWFLLLVIIFASCISSKDSIYPINNIGGKEYVGVVVKSTTIKAPTGKFTLVETDLMSIPVQGKINIKKGTKCYTYYIQGLRNKRITMLIWDKALRGYELNK